MTYSICSRKFKRLHSVYLTVGKFKRAQKNKVSSARVLRAFAARCFLCSSSSSPARGASRSQFHSVAAVEPNRSVTETMWGSQHYVDPALARTQLGPATALADGRFEESSFTSALGSITWLPCHQALEAMQLMPAACMQSSQYTALTPEPTRAQAAAPQAAKALKEAEHDTAGQARAGEKTSEKGNLSVLFLLASKVRAINFSRIVSSS
jgi:hypothetical protein